MAIVIRRDIVLQRASWEEGALDGVRSSGGSLVFDHPTGVTGTYETATWTGPVAHPGFTATEIIPSWTADTPGGSFLRIEIGVGKNWYNLGEWSTGEVRTSIAGQEEVEADTLKLEQGITGWRARVTLLRPHAGAGLPSVHSLCVMASALPSSSQPSTPLAARGVILDVPRYSQKVYEGGSGWCSPVSTAMVLSYWGLDVLPEQAARDTFDPAYKGCGNWSFNTAYAGRFGVNAFVTRLRSLNEAEVFIDAGIPLIVSASYGKGEIPGLDYHTEGHLMVLIGFTDDGNPVLNDPNSATHADVRKAVDRASFESAWLNTSKGVVYVIHPATVALPPALDQANW